MIKDLLNTIPKNLRNQLMFAFEQNLEQLIDLEEDTFLGVNLVRTDDLDILEEAGKFTYGRKK